MESTKHFQIAVDGTAASGKSTVARGLAEKLGISYLDTGKLYRAVSLAFSRGTGVDPADWSDDLAKDLLARVHLELKPALGRECRVFLEGEDVTELLGDPGIEKSVSFAARLPYVRAWLLDLQRNFASSSSVVLAGRDIGTVVLPQADIKVFMTASLGERARRRLLQQGLATDKEQLEKAKTALSERDSLDANRKCAPMVASEGALVLDSTSRTPEELIGQIIESLQVLIGG